MTHRCVWRNICCVIRTTAPDLLPLFRSRLQAQLLARLFVYSDNGETLSDLARALGVDRASVQREVDRLERAGIVASQRVGRARVVTADTSSPVHAELRALLRKAFGPAPALEEALSRVPGVEAAYIFGSWARRYHGEPGPLPRDVDVLVIGSADADAVYEAVQAVEPPLGLEVNPVVVTDAEWTHPLGIVSRVKREPLVELEVKRADDR